jgi:hypothetical protein
MNWVLLSEYGPTVGFYGNGNEYYGSINATNF